MKAVIFDLDDTLILERDYVFSGYRAVAKYLGAKAGTDEDKIYGLLREEFERSAKNVFNRMYDRLGIGYTEEDIKDLVRVYREHEPDIGFCEDVLPALKDLKEAGCRLGVLTDGYLVTQKNKAKAVELGRHFEAIVYTDELGREYWKPSVKGFEILSEKLGAPLDSMVYVGDNPGKDFEIMKAAPIKTVRIIREGGVYAEAPYGGECRENKRITSLSALRKAIEELF